MSSSKVRLQIAERLKTGPAGQQLSWRTFPKRHHILPMPTGYGTLARICISRKYRWHRVYLASNDIVIVVCHLLCSLISRQLKDTG